MLRQKLIINISNCCILLVFSLHTLLTMHGHRNLKLVYTCISSPPLYQWWCVTLILSLTVLGLHHRIVVMSDVVEKKNRRGVMLQKSCWKFYHILLTLQSSNNCPHNSFLTWLGLLALFVYRCVLMLSEEESHMAVCICRSGSEFCIICFAVLGTVWLSLGVCKFSKSRRNLSILCVSMVLWNMSHTEVSQILGAAVQNEATWAMYARCGHLCQSDTVELAEMYERKWDQSVHIDSTCLVVAMVCFTAVTQLLMNGTNLY